MSDDAKIAVAQNDIQTIKDDLVFIKKSMVTRNEFDNHTKRDMWSMGLLASIAVAAGKFL